MNEESRTGWLTKEILGASYSIDILVDLNPISRRYSLLSDGLGYLTGLTALADLRLKLRCGVHLPTGKNSETKEHVKAFIHDLVDRGWEVKSVPTPPSLDLFIIDQERCYTAYSDGAAYGFNISNHPKSVETFISYFDKIWRLNNSDSEEKSLLFEDLIELEIPEKGSELAQISSTTWDNFIRLLSKNPEELHTLAPIRFEELVAELLIREGFSIHITGKTRDGGRDILATQYDLLGEHLYLVECKRWSPNRPIGVDIVRELYGVVEYERASAGILVTTSRFTSGALSFVSPIQYRMTLREYNDVVAWIKKLS